jgi:hypothetical protein
LRDALYPFCVSGMNFRHDNKLRDLKCGNKKISKHALSCLSPTLDPL